MLILRNTKISRLAYFATRHITRSLTSESIQLTALPSMFALASTYLTRRWLEGCLVDAALLAVCRNVVVKKGVNLTSGRSGEKHRTFAQPGSNRTQDFGEISEPKIFGKNRSEIVWDRYWYVQRDVDTLDTLDGKNIVWR